MRLTPNRGEDSPPKRGEVASSPLPPFAVGAARVPDPNASVARSKGLDGIFILSRNGSQDWDVDLGGT